jgi:hypothetical protein
MLRKLPFKNIFNLFLVLAFAVGLSACNEGNEQKEKAKQLRTNLELFEGSFRPPSPTPSPTPEPEPTPIPAPDAPVINALPAFVTTGSFTVTGSGTAGTEVSLVGNGILIDTVPVDLSLNWLVPVGPYEDGPVSFTAIARFPDGEASAPSVTVSTIIDTTAPSAPIINRPTLPSNTSTPTIEGLAEEATTIIVFIDGAENGTTITTAEGTWFYTPETGLADGTYLVTATATDEAGNISPLSNEWTVVVDTVPPVAPTINQPAGGVTNLSRPTIGGTSEEGSLVQVFSDDVLIGVTFADGDGTWELVPADEFPNGTYEITAVATDEAGLDSPTSDPFTLTVDVSAPAAPVVEGPANVTDTDTPTITGTSLPLVDVTVFLNGAVNGTTTSNEVGDWEYTVAAPLANASYAVTAQVTDGGGSISPLSAPFTMTVEVP